MGVMTGLFIAIDELVDPLEEEVSNAVEKVMEEDYYFISSISNIKGWETIIESPQQRLSRQRRERALRTPRDAHGHFIKKEQSQ